MDLIYTTLGVLFITLVSGLGFLAYRNPHTFKEFGLTISFVCAAIFLAMLSYSVGVSMGGGIILQFVADENLRNAHGALEAMKPDLLIFGAAFLGVCVFILVTGLISIGRRPQ